MKIIGKFEGGYIASIGHEELEKFLNQYYGKLDKLKVGEEIDLGRGYDFASQINRALSETKSFISANKKIVEAIINGLSVVGTDAGQKEAGQ